MQDDGTDDAQADDEPALQFVALSLRDGLDAERVYHKNSGLDLSNPQSLQVRFLRALRTGQVDAIGYLPPRLPESLPVLIPDNAWDQCQFDWESAELQGAGFHFVDVRILMSVCVFERHNLFYLHQPVTMLAPFPPSDDKRLQLKLPAESPRVATIAGAAPKSKNEGGRPSLREEILAAFDAITKEPNWGRKQLTKQIRDRVNIEIGQEGEKNLTDGTIKKILAKHRPISNCPRS